jgi:hypothetical protein
MATAIFKYCAAEYFGVEVVVEYSQTKFREIKSDELEVIADY